MGLLSAFRKKDKDVYEQAVKLACKDLSGRGVENIWRYRDALLDESHKAQFNDAVKGGLSSAEIADRMVMNVLAHRMRVSTASVDL